MKLVICGIGGRMGRAVLSTARALEHEVLAGVDRASATGADVPVHDALATALSLSPECVIDFTAPEASLEHARACAAVHVPLVIGTTGFSVPQRAELQQLAVSVPLVVAPNMSVGVNVMIAAAAELTRRLGPDFDVEILEAHHKMKKDSPSGTALKLAEEIAQASGRTRHDFRLAREGQIGERPAREIGVQALRGGDVVGEHTVFFFGEGERVELTHRATAREQFARGALRAAGWVRSQPPGLYDMRDVLGLK
jgi:4-hydroxy-tetrahydrodipicolinate reductase